ncbi:MAG: zincin-like metallopeptidase domain-containing protein [[Pasteurella] mairii]|uniref:DNA primase TraC n=1 Tax=[Pasteurella] mairii TaxID=757 RepID=A0A379B7H1_9PAST|nr:zincin-like metallopeptidase domain-containing protein [[Pasteurella] mairii]SUB34432.1 DNA primase TraC [[Pasteurella] mairii]
MNSQIQHKPDLYQEITDRIIKCLEEGAAPWLKPWNSPDYNLALPKNAVSGRLYSGVNILLLWMASAEKGYKQSKWLTAQSANKLGGHVRKGEKATIIVNYRPVDREKLDDEGNTILDDEGNPEMEHFALLKRHAVFNIEQCENLPQYLYDDTHIIKNDEDPYEIFREIRQIIDGMSVKVDIKPQNKAYYSSAKDVIAIPEIKQFTSEQEFYSVLLHEITHATGHKDRLNREGVTGTSGRLSKVYAFEELVAEMGSAFLCAHIGFNTVQQNAGYINGWIQLLKEDKRAIFKASGKAREACQYMFDCLQVMEQYERLNFAA